MELRPLRAFVLQLLERARLVTVTVPGIDPLPVLVELAERGIASAATAGTLSISTGSATVGALPFRRASFNLELQTFQGFNDQAADARQEPTLRTARRGHASLLVGDYVYVIGGSGASGSLQSIERARVNADGSLDPFTVADATLVEARANHTSVVVGTVLYVIGGTDGAGVLNSVERATINADGSLGSFATVTGVTLATARKAAASVVVGNFLYVLGGASSGFLDSIERARINADGSLDTFVTVPDVTLSVVRASHTAVVVGNQVYVLGGSNASGVSRSVDRASISDDGSIGRFVSVASGNLGIARAGHICAVLGDSLYAIGGTSSTGGIAATEQATIQPDGSLGQFVTAAGRTLSKGRSGHSAIMIGNFLYIVGGSSTAQDGDDLASVERAAIDASGVISSFTSTVNIALTIGSSITRTAVVGSWLYVFENDQVERASIRADGSLGTFEIPAGTTLPAGRTGYTVATAGNHIYLVGGGSSASPGADKAVDSALIAVDGSIGAFSPVAGVSLVNDHLLHSSAVVNNSLYVLGGSGPSSNSPSIERATIKPDGSLSGSFTDTGSFTPLNSESTSVVIGQFIYLIGVGSNEAQVQRAAINADGSLGPFGALNPALTLAVPRFLPTSVVIGSYIYVLGGTDPSGNYVTSVERALIGSDGSLGTFSVIQAGPKRAGGSAVTVGNMLYVVGGHQTSFTTLVKTVDQATLQ